MPECSTAEVCDRGEKIYDERIKSLVEPQEIGKFIVIDIESGDYEISEDMLEASDSLQKRRPDSVQFGAMVGHESAYLIG